MNLERQKAFIIHAAYITLILGLVYVSIKYFLPLLMPFVIGMIVALVFRPLIDLIHEKTRMKRSLVSIFILILFYSLLALLISLIGLKVFTYIENLFYRLPALYADTIEPAIRKIADNLILRFPEIEYYVEEFLENISVSIFDYLKTISSTVVTAITGFAGQLPALLIKFIFTIVSSFFFTIDYYRIGDFVMRQFKGERGKMVLRLKANGIGVGGYMGIFILGLTFFIDELKHKGPGDHSLGLDAFLRPVVLDFSGHNAGYIFLKWHFPGLFVLYDINLQAGLLVALGPDGLRKLGLFHLFLRLSGALLRFFRLLPFRPSFRGTGCSQQGNYQNSKDETEFSVSFP